MRTPPPEFVAARNALAKELRAAGERDDASAVAALRRPSWVDWALVRVADDDPDAVVAFAAAAAAMRDAQDAAVGGRSADVAGALRAVRDAASTLAKRADATLRGAGRDTELPAILERLTAVAGDAGATAALAAGELHADLTPDQVVDASPVAPPPTRPAPRRARRQRTEPPPEPPPPPPPSRREVDQATAALRLAERGVARAERRAGEAEHARENAERAAAKAEAALAAANDQAADARRRLAEAQAALADAAATVAALTGEPRR